MRASEIILCLTMLAPLHLLARADNSATLLASGRVDEAIANLQDEISRSPDNPLAQNLLCRAYFSLAQWDSGMGPCEKAVTLDPNNSLYHLWLGRIYGEKASKSGFMAAAGLAKKLRSEFEEAVRLNPKNVDAHTDLAEFYLEAPGIVGGGRDKAEAEAAKLEVLDPAKAHWVRARIAEKKKDLSVAEHEYREAITVSGGSASSWLNLGLFYRHAKRLDEMEEALRHVPSARIDRPDALVDAADVLIRSDRDLGAAAELLHRYLSSEQTVEQAPAFKAHFLLGTVFEKRKDKAGAVQEYHAALALAKQYAPAQKALDRLNR